MKDLVLWRNRVSSSVLITIEKVNATFRLKARGLLVGAFGRMLPAIGLTRTLYRYRIILIFLRRCQEIFQSQGMKGLVNWLKANTVILQQSLGGFKLHDMTELKCRVSRNLAGMPRLVAASDRALIRKGNTDIMRFNLTLFNLYRVLEFPGQLKLGTITGPFKGNMELGGTYLRVCSYIPAFVKMLKALENKNSVQSLASRGIETPMILKSAPQSASIQVSTSPMVLLLSAFGLRVHGLEDCIQYFIGFFKGTKIPYPGIATIFDRCASAISPEIPSFTLAVTAMGKLGFKEEAAGKVRVFAMVDAWTQWVMKPFHEYIFDILRHIPMDGTFDQLKPVREKASQVSCAYSLDLSAATDRLPLSIQILLYKSLVNDEFAIRWAKLLVGRGYLANKEKYKVSEILYYSVGQPMGALSSWGSLAIIHHFIVQAAAWDAGVVKVGTWFKEYAVLGDDLVIFNKRVKEAYLRIIGALGVECGIAKSLLSPKGTAIEFAKRTLWKGVDISPIPLTEFVAANLTVGDAVLFARKYGLTFQQLVRALGYGYRVCGSLNKHVGSLNSRVRALLFAYHLPASETDVTESLFQGNLLISKEQLTNVVKEFKELLMNRYYARIEARLRNLASTPELIKRVGMGVVEALSNRVNRKLPAWWPEGFDVPGYIDVAKGLRNEAIGPITENQQLAITPVTGTESGLTPREHLANDARHRDWVLAAESVVKLLINKPLSDFRAEAADLLWDIKGLRFNRSLYLVYANSLGVLKNISSLGQGKVSFYRAADTLPFRADPAAMRYWQDFTACILKVVRPKDKT